MFQTHYELKPYDLLPLVYRYLAKVGYLEEAKAVKQRFRAEYCKEDFENYPLHSHQLDTIVDRYVVQQPQLLRFYLYNEIKELMAEGVGHKCQAPKAKVRLNDKKQPARVEGGGKPKAKESDQESQQPEPRPKKTVEAARPKTAQAKPEERKFQKVDPESASKLKKFDYSFEGKNRLSADKAGIEVYQKLSTTRGEQFKKQKGKLKDRMMAAGSLDDQVIREVAID